MSRPRTCFDTCVKCDRGPMRTAAELAAGKTGIRHHALGLCLNCYMAIYRATRWLPQRKEAA